MIVSFFVILVSDTVIVANSILDGNEILFASSDLVREGDINCEVLLLRKELPSVFSDICMWSIIIIFKPSNNIKI